MKYDLLCLGELLIDFVEQNKLHDLTDLYQANAGGAPGNVACTSQRFGLKTGFIGAVGDDVFGRILIDTLRSNEVDVRGVQVIPNVMTTLAFVSLGSEGIREFTFARKGSADTQLSLNETQNNLISNTQALHFGTLSLTDEPAKTATLEAVRKVAEQGGIVSFDPNVRLNLWHSMSELQEAYRAGLEYANILKISDEDFEALEGGLHDDSFLDRLGKLFDENLRLLLLTLGKNGSIAYWRSDGIIHSAHAPTDLTRIPIDTTGAGDIFTGAFLSQLLAELTQNHRSSETLEKYLEQVNEVEIYRMLLFANQVASLSTERHGGITSIPDINMFTEAYGQEQSINQ